MESTKIVEEYCQKYKDVKSLTLARFIAKEHPELGKTVEQLRSNIRYRRGKNGDLLRVARPDKKLFSEDKSNREWAEVKTKEPGITGPAKVLVFDIETAPNRAYVWRLWKQTVGHEMLISPWFMITWSAKWLFEDKIINAKLTKKEILAEDDRRITESIWKLLDEADIVIAHNGDKFDLRMLNTRFLNHGMTSPSPYLSIDTLKHARQRFNIPSNRLDYLGQFLKVGRKKDHEGFELWAKCLKGDPEAMQNMMDYNDQDVLLLERVYLKLRPFIKPHPNLGLYIADDIQRCPSCGSDKLQAKGTYRTYINNYDSFHCQNCGSWSRSRVSSTGLKRNPNLMSSLPK